MNFLLLLDYCEENVAHSQEGTRELVTQLPDKISTIERAHTTAVITYERVELSTTP